MLTPTFLGRHFSRIFGYVSFSINVGFDTRKRQSFSSAAEGSNLRDMSQTFDKAEGIESPNSITNSEKEEIF